MLEFVLFSGQESSPSCSSEQNSPVSSCQSSVGSDHQDGDEPYTLGATVNCPYECTICKRAYARSSALSKHVQVCYCFVLLVRLVNILHLAAFYTKIAQI